MGNLIQQEQIHQMDQGNVAITYIHCITVITKIRCIHQQTDVIPYISLAKW